jgi:membrane-associated phospholipid phosphatase
MGLAASTAKAQSAGQSDHDLEHTDATFLGVEVGASFVLSGALLLAAGSPASQCGWCATNAFDENIRRALLASDPQNAGAVSHAFSSGAAPALALAALLPPALATGHARHALENVIIAADAAVLTLGVTHASKRIFDRQRPGAHYGVMDQTEYASDRAQWNQSFFSADTSLAFSLGASATTLAYLRGYRIAPYVLVASSVIGVTTAWLRVAADVHWATDVLTGAAVGTAIGFAVPYGLHRRQGALTEHQMLLVPVLGSGQLGLLAAASF